MRLRRRASARPGRVIAAVLAAGAAAAALASAPGCAFIEEVGGPPGVTLQVLSRGPFVAAPNVAPVSPPAPPTLVALDRAGAAPGQAAPPAGAIALKSVACALDGDCAEIFVAGRPPAAPCLSGARGGAPLFERCPVSGLADASLRHDPSTGALWLAYAVETLVLVDPGADGLPRAAPAAGVGLAWSEDGGRSWRDAGLLEAAAAERLPRYGAGPRSARAPSLTALPDGGWAVLWRRDFDGAKAVALQGRVGETPGHLTLAPSRSLYAGWANPKAWRAKRNLAGADPLAAHCATFEAASLLAEGERLFLAALCADFDVATNARRHARGGVHLFELTGSRPGDGVMYVGELFSAADAAATLGVAPGRAAAAHPELARARDGAPILLVSLSETPAGAGGPARARGCHAVEIADLGAAALRRAAGAETDAPAEAEAEAPEAAERAGPPVLRAHAGLADSARAGGAALAGGCAYDPNGALGIVMSVAVEDAEARPQRRRAQLVDTRLHP